MNLLLEGAIESSLILLVALGATALLRARPAALRHAVLAAAIACAAIAPLLGRAVPAWPLPSPLAALTADTSAALQRAGGPVGGVDRAGVPVHGEVKAAPSPSGTSRVLAVLRAIWIAGVASTILGLAIGFRRLGGIASRARRIKDTRWTHPAEAIAGRYGLSTPVALLLSAHPSLIVTWGLRRPKVVLPAVAAGWPDERVRIVLFHELAHVRRGDWLVLLGAEVVKCVYWFHPLVWIACARLREESEQACDDEVINQGVDAAAYAGELVDIARDLARGRPWLPAPAISRSSRFERRVQAMLDKRRNRRPVSRGAYAAIVAVAVAVAMTIASAQGGFASVTGSIVDPMDAAMPGVTLVLTNVARDAKYEVRTDGSGRYEFVGLPPGEYLFEAKLPGFATFKGKLAVAGQNVQRDLKMDVGSLQETITVANSRSAPSAAVPATASAIRPGAPPRACDITPAADGVRIGGSVRPPLKLKDVRPFYSPQLATQGVEGTVTLKGRIGTDGFIEDLEVVSTPHADLAQAAMDAVRQWEFTTTLLNCKPVAVSIGINVNFTLKP
ncbi:MAG TPA: M56 family metallopeptidase [Vicinamibacterales bacterium]|jgi:TonB family protein|nr:M56 family metallopeptidase [Vicinamibacterales bacterium]